MLVNWQNVIDKNKLFWQYPVCTEKEFYTQNKSDYNYVGFPWATVIDKNTNHKLLFQILNYFIDNDIEYYTCCQHISFRNLKTLFEDLNITTVFTSHKQIGEEKMGTVTLLPCPLYAVNVEDNTRNSIFLEKDLKNIDRKYLYSFVVASRADYITDIRNRIFNLPKKDAYIQHTGGWHFDELVFTDAQNYNKSFNVSQSHKEKTELYNNILLNSRYSLCPSGTGPNSIRFWESLAVGAIPVLLAATLELPCNNLWLDSIIRIEESSVQDIPDILRGISENEERSRRDNCLRLYNFYRANYANRGSI